MANRILSPTLLTIPRETALFTREVVQKREGKGGVVGEGGGRGGGKGAGGNCCNQQEKTSH